MQLRERRKLRRRN